MQDTITLSGIWNMIARRKAAILVICAAAGALVFCVEYFAIPRRYNSEATVLLNTDTLSSSGFDLKAVADLVSNKAFERTEKNYEAVLQSRLVAQRVFLSPGIIGRYKSLKRFAGMDTGQIVESQRDLLKVRLESKEITIQFQGPTPQLAADVVNRYIAELEAFFTDSTRNKRMFLETRLAQFKTRLAEIDKQAEQAVGPDKKILYTQLMRDKLGLEQTYAVTFLEYQRALMDEQRKDKWFIVLDTGSAPLKKSFPHTLRDTALAVAAAFFLACYLAIALGLRESKKKTGGQAA